MNKIFLTAVLTTGLAAGCAETPVTADNAFGESLAHMVEDQTLNPAATAENGEVAVSEGDGQRLEKVLEGYRTDSARGTADVKREVRFTVGN